MTDITQYLHTYHKAYAPILKALAKPYSYDSTFELRSLSPIDEHLYRGRMKAVVHGCEGLFDRYCSDIRIIGLYLYASNVWMTGQGAVQLFPVLKLLLRDFADQLTPPNLSEKEQAIELDRDLSSLFRRMNRRLDFYARTNKPELDQWIDELDGESVYHLCQEGESFVLLLSQQFKDSGLVSTAPIRQFIQQVEGIELPIRPEQGIDRGEKAEV